MCGIAGIRKFGDTPISPAQLEILLCACESRGNHATGIALQQPDGEIAVLKDDAPAYRFIAGDKFKKFMKDHLNKNTTIALLHTRLATQGSPRNNNNNHPLFHGKSAVTHNGMIHNDGVLFRELKLDRKGEVDSDILRAIIDENGITPNGIRELKKIRGGAAIAAISTDFPGKLLLARTGNPIVMASTEDTLVWASEKDFIHKAMRPFVKRFGTIFQIQRPDLAFLTMNNNSAYIFGNMNKAGNALEYHDSFDCTYTNYNPPTYQVHKNYQSSRARFYDNGKLPEELICPNQKCLFVNHLSEALRTERACDIICGKCDQPLGEIPVAAS